MKKYKSSGIYKITNIVNGKFYIGSAVNFQKRRNDHLYKLRKKIHANYHLQNAYNMYGEDNFIFEVIEHIIDKTKLIESEQRWLDELLPFGDIGYNICKEARSILGIKRKPEVGAKISKANTGRKNTEEVKDKIRQTKLSQNLKMPQYLKDILSTVNKERMTGRIVSPETRKKISLSTKGVPNTKLKGITLKKEHKDKISKSLKGRDALNRVKVDQYDLDGIFIKTHESMRAAGIGAGKASYSRNIYTVCIGKQKTAYGFIWKYHDVNKNI